jgi:hypothetical protein
VPWTTASQPTGVAAGDYLATLTVTSQMSGPVTGEIDLYINGTGQPQRAGTFQVPTSATQVTAQVRTTGPTDVISVTAFGTATIGTVSLTPASWGYVVRGTNITTPTSSNVVFHGVNSSDSMKLPVDIQVLNQQTKANIVRVPVTECEWMPYFTAAYQPTYRQQVINTVNAVLANGDTAIVDLQHSCHDDPKSVAVPASSTMTGPDTHALAFWTDVATLFQGDSNVMFELFNEPKMGAKDVEPDGHTGAQTWHDGGVLSAGGWTWTAPGMQELYDAVRATGANNVVLVDGTAWSSNLVVVEQNPIIGTNIAYAYHAYAPQGTNPAVCPPTLNSVVWPVIDPNGNFREAGIATEFGTTAQDITGLPTGSQYLASCVSWFAAHSNANWIVWGWYPRALDTYGILYAYPLTPTTRTQPILNGL